MKSVRLLTACGLAAVLVAAALVVPSAGRPADVATLTGTVGPGFTISLTDASGAKVTHLDPGDYTIVVHDLADIHDFHLAGPGVDQVTSVEGTDDTTWHVTLTDGTYTYVCDPHSTTMNGSFTVGNAAPPPPPTTTTAAPPPAPKPAVPVRLVATVGPGFTIGLKTVAGAKAVRLKRGAYTITVRDRASIHNFVLVGPGVNRATSVAGKGTFTWKVTLRAGTYRFYCAPHRTVMKGSFKVA
jgi:plastocyanin